MESQPVNMYFVGTLSAIGKCAYFYFERRIINEHPKRKLVLPMRYTRTLACEACGLELSGEEKIFLHEGDILCTQCYRDELGCESEADFEDLLDNNTRSTTVEEYLQNQDDCREDWLFDRLREEALIEKQGRITDER